MDEDALCKDTLAKIEAGRAEVGILGLGYVGLPLALAFAEKFSVIGYDVDARKRKMLRSGKSYVDDITDQSLKDAVKRNVRITDDSMQLKECDAVIICVPTPLDARGNPDLSHVAQSAEIVRKIVRKGMLLVFESTSYPGTTEEYFGRAVRCRGLEPGRDVFLAFSPERVDPGNKKFTIRNTPKIVGGCEKHSTEIAAALYSRVIDADVICVSDCRTAEACKIVENIFRGVNIALINELALIFERMEIDTWEVVKAASTKPFAFMPHYPGPGVGGHCIPLDPLYMSYKAKQYGIVPRFIELSREVNEFMKHHTVNLTMSALDDAGIEPEKATVAVMGISYKKNIADTRESPAAEIVSELSKKVSRVIVHDPHAKSILTPIGEVKSRSLDAILSTADCLVFVTDHDEFCGMTMKQLHGKHVKAIVDTRNLFHGDDVRSAGLTYKALGK